MRTKRTEPSNLLIDRAAAAEIPTGDSLRDWARDKRVFISSVMSELASERVAVAEAIEEFGATPILFERFGGRDADPENAYLGELETCDLYIGILGAKYGKPLRSRFSPTHTEFRHAEQSGLRLALWASHTADREGPEQSFLDDARTFYVVPTFSSVVDLKHQVSQRLRSIGAEDITPWVKLGHLIFRAVEVVERREALKVTARIRSADVVHAVEALRPDKWNSSEALKFSWSGRSRHVRITDVHSRTTTTRSTLCEIEMEKVDAPEDHMRTVTINSLTPAQLLEMGLRSALFGEKNPLQDRAFGFTFDVTNPLAALQEFPVAEEILRPVAELLFVDELVGGRRAERILQFKLGATLSDGRKLSLTVQPAKFHRGERIEPFTISGAVLL